MGGLLGFFQKGHLAVERMLCLVNGTGNGGLSLNGVKEGIGLTDKDIISLKKVQMNPEFTALESKQGHADVE